MVYLNLTIHTDISFPVATAQLNISDFRCPSVCVCEKWYCDPSLLVPNHNCMIFFHFNPPVSIIFLYANRCAIPLSVTVCAVPSIALLWCDVLSLAWEKNIKRSSIHPLTLSSQPPPLPGPLNTQKVLEETMALVQIWTLQIPKVRIQTWVTMGPQWSKTIQTMAKCKIRNRNNKITSNNNNSSSTIRSSKIHRTFLKREIKQCSQITTPVLLWCPV